MAAPRGPSRTARYALSNCGGALDKNVRAIATALTHRSVGLDSFGPEQLCDPDVLALAARVDCSVIETQLDTSAVVVVHEHGGREHVIRTNDIPGDPGRPLARQEMERKFADCAGRAAMPLGADAIASLLTAVDSLEQIKDVAELMNVVPAAS